MAAGLEELVGLPDPVGDVVRGSVLPNGLQLRQIRVPLGVVAIIYEARPNVTVDAAGIALKSGNAALLRGSGSAYASNAVLVDLLAEAGSAAGLPADAVALVPGTDRESVTHLMTARGLVDVIIPRGGAGLIQAVVNGSTVPVIETGVGNCHVYVDAGADPAMAVDILINSKVRRPSVCNAAETLLVHQDIAAGFRADGRAALHDAGVTVHADRAALDLLDASALTVPATAEDFDTEYLSLDIAAAVVDDLDAAIAHIRTHGTGHTEAIVTRDLGRAETVHRSGGRRRGDGQRLHRVHRRRRVRFRRRDRHLHPEIARQGADGIGRIDQHQVCGRSATARSGKPHDSVERQSTGAGSG